MGQTTARVEAVIRERIASGTWEPGAKLPSERALTEELSVGRTTVRLVLSKLASEGWVEAQHGRGYFVTEPKPVSRVVTDHAADEPAAWKIHGERRIYDNEWVKLDLVNVEPPGMEPFDHHVVRLSHVAVAAVLDDEDRVLMLWRYRFVPHRWGWELPGGIVDAGEGARMAAAREVEEETGWRPGPLTHVVTFEPVVGMVESPHDIFVGRGAERVGEPSDLEETGRVEWVPLKDIPLLMARGELMGSGTLVGLLHLLASRT